MVKMFVLIWSFSAGATGITTGSHEFNSKEHCEAAAAAISSSPTFNRTYDRAICVEK